MHYDILYSCISHIGNVRKLNQDNFICNDKYLNSDEDNLEFPVMGYIKPKAPVLFGVFDGMGGEECGEIASLIATEAAFEVPMTKKGSIFFTEYCKHANEKICKYADENQILAMGTTAAMLLFCKREITLCNIGDSKVFRFSNCELEQISKDHVTVSTFGKKPPLSQNLGIPSNLLVIEPYLSQGRYKNGDKYLICSDGLTDMLTNDEIKEVLNNFDTQKATSVLLEKALEAGGKDNITVILVELTQSKNNITNIFKRQRKEQTYEM